MMAVWSLEWRLALRDRRRFALSAIVPFLLALSVATGVADPAPAAAVYLVIFVVVAVFGIAVPLRWDGERGIIGRVVRGGVPASRYFLARAAACTTIDVVQLTPALLVVVVGTRASPGASAVALAALVVAVWVGALIGILTAAFSRSLAETGLIAALGVLLLAHMSGVFEDPPPGSMLASLERMSPFRALYEALQDLTAGVSVGGIGSAVAWAVALPLLVVLGSRWIYGSLGKVARGGLEGV